MNLIITKFMWQNGTRINQYLFAILCNNIAIDHLSQLNQDHLKELCPQIGNRIKLTNKINEYLDSKINDDFKYLYPDKANRFKDCWKFFMQKLIDLKREEINSDENKINLLSSLLTYDTEVTIPLLSFGMIQGWISPMISLLQSPEGPSPEPFTSSDISWMTSVTYITAIIFGAPMGHLTDRFGRKMMTLATTLSLIVYWQITLFCMEPWAMILARAIAGIPCSSCYIVLPIYLKEISDIDLRGALGSLLIMNRNIGYLASYIGADLLDVTTMLWLGLAVPTIVFFILLIMPETPEFLVKQGKVDEAKKVLAWLRGVSVVDRGVEQDIDAIVATEKQTKADDKSVWKIILKDRPTFKAFIITLVIKITQQFDGYLIVLIYAGFVFERATESIDLNMSPNKQIMMIGLVQLIGSTMATCIVEKTGRKLLLVTTSFAVGVGMLMLSGWFYFTSVGTWLPGWLPVFAMCLCIFADAAGFHPISYIIITDMFTFQLRGTVSSFANVCAKLSNFIQMKWFASLCDLIGMHWTFLFFATVCFTASVYSLVYFPETRNKTVPEIYAKLSKKEKENKTEAVP